MCQIRGQVVKPWFRGKQINNKDSFLLTGLIRIYLTVRVRKCQNEIPNYNMLVRNFSPCH